MFSQPNAVGKPQFGLGKEAALQIKRLFVGNISKVFAAKIQDLFTINADMHGCNLLVITDNNNLVRDVVQKERFRPRLTCFVDDNYVKLVSSGPSCLNYLIQRHDPSWNRLAAFV